MPTKRIFDLVLITTVLTHAVVGLVKMNGRRWARETSGILQTAGEAVAVGL